MDSASAQLTSILGTSMFNELRVQYARRHQFRTPSPSAVDGPAITVTGIAQFGGPRLGDTNSVGFDFKQGIWQVVDNVSWIRGRHSFKAGIDAQCVGDDRVKGERFEYVFPTIDAYLAASAGTAPLGYTTFRQDFGDLTASYSSGFYGFFVQDDWQVTPNLKVLYGLRYDLFDVPSARSFAANPYSQDFTIDKSNWGPRAGLSWSLDGSGRSVLRASTGLMYEPPLLDFYDNAILNNGDPRSYTVQLAGTSAGAPAFPASLANAPRGVRAAAAEHQRRRSRIPDAVGVADQRAVRAGRSHRHVGRRRLRELDRPEPAGADGHQPDSDGRGRCPTAGRCFPPRSTPRPASIPPSITSTCSSRLARRNTTRSRRRSPSG